MKVAIVGGTGTFGRALARRLHGLGYEVFVGSRDATRGRERAIELGVDGGSNEEGAETARPAPGVLEAIAAAELLLVAPSNPFVSIGPILAVAEIRAALERRRVPAVAVSPLIGGRAVKGPADAMLARLAGGTTPAHVARCYAGLVDVLVIDAADEDGADAVADLGMRPVVTRTLMRDEDARRRLMESMLEAAGAFA